MSRDIGKIPYKAGITREQFLFHEMRTTAKLMNKGFNDEEIVNEIIEDNLFQYPTEKRRTWISLHSGNRAGYSYDQRAGTEVRLLE